jgi:cyclophilin family peptidyl-prolyl cis-trans isomerase
VNRLRPVLLVTLALGLLAPQALGAPETGNNARAYLVSTELGAFTLELRADDYPQSAAEFRTRCAFGYYHGALIARRPQGRLIQLGTLCAGGPAPELSFAPEPGASLQAGDIAWALPRQGWNAGYPFFICLDACPDLGTRYTPFAQVVEGMDIAAQLQPGDELLSIVPVAVPEKRRPPLGGRQ